VGRSAAGAAVGVEEAVARGGVSTGEELSIMLRYSCLSTVATNLLADAFSARDNFRIILSVGDFNPLSSWLT
jgi:hypothetical protein